MPVDPQLMLSALRESIPEQPFEQAAFVGNNPNNTLPEMGGGGIGGSAGGALRAAPNYGAQKFTPQIAPSPWNKSTNPAAQTYPSELTYNAGRNVVLGNSQNTPSGLQSELMKQNVPMTYQQTIQLLRVLGHRGIVGPMGEGGVYPTLVGKNKIK